MNRNPVIPICLALAALAPLQAGASMPVQQVTVTLSAAAEGNQITANGQTYQVPATPENEQLLESLRPGDQVELWVGQSPAGSTPTVSRITLRAKAAAQ